MAIVPSPGVQQSGLGWLVVVAAGMLLGIVTLAHNRIGNFSIYPSPRAGARLVTSGPYRLVRHPMYGALVTMMVGIAGYNGTLQSWLGAILVSGVVVAKALLEERLMMQRFPEYRAYAAGTRRFLPFIL